MVAPAEVRSDQFVTNLVPDHAGPRPGLPQPTPSPAAAGPAATCGRGLMVHQHEAQCRHPAGVVSGALELLQPLPYGVDQFLLVRPVDEQRPGPGRQLQRHVLRRGWPVPRRGAQPVAGEGCRHHRSPPGCPGCGPLGDPAASSETAACGSPAAAGFGGSALSLSCSILALPNPLRRRTSGTKRKNGYLSCDHLVTDDQKCSTQRG